jgi:hypothetical protein
VKTRVTSTAAVLALAPCPLQQNIETILFSVNCSRYQGNYSYCRKHFACDKTVNLRTVYITVALKLIHNITFYISVFHIKPLMKTRVTSTAAVLALAPCALQQNIETILVSVNCSRYQGNYSYCC